MSRRKERREHPRISTSLHVVVGTQDGGTNARMVANNLSLGGLYCTSSTDYPEMTILAVQLMLPAEGTPNGSDSPIDFEAVVVRREKRVSVAGEPRYELGLFFTSISDDARSLIRGFLN